MIQGKPYDDIFKAFIFTIEQFCEQFTKWEDRQHL